MRRLMPEDNVMPKNIYETKNLVLDMGLPVQKIHCCRNGCMIYWGYDSELSEWFSGMQPLMHPTTSMPLRPQVTYPPRGGTPSAPFFQSPTNEEEA
ncbi:hypothetical protein V6N13_092652 [Hibiscus sabdariffa]